MRKLIAGPFVSLDGVAELSEPWTMPYFSNDMKHIIQSGMEEADTMLMGRRTYEQMAAYWPGMTAEDDPFAEYLNKVPKLVVSTTLTSVNWTNSTLITSDVLGQIAKLKEQSGKDIQIPGSATLVRSLLRAGLVDQLRLLVFPLVLGRGSRFFEGVERKVPMRLTQARALSHGVVSLVYEPEPVIADLGHDLPGDLPGPARRALANAGFTTLDQLTVVSESELLQLHGVGRTAITRLREALTAVGKSFAP